MQQTIRNQGAKLGVGLLLALAVCNATLAQDVRTNSMPGVDFAKYHTYRWVASNRVLGLTVATYLDDVKDAVTLDVRVSSLQDGTRYPASEVLDAKAKNLSVNLSNSGYRKTGLCPKG